MCLLCIALLCTHLHRLDVDGGVCVVMLCIHLSRFGVDGGGCLRRALCELATMPSLRLQGVVGEMIDMLLRYVPPTGCLCSYEDGQ